MVAGPDESLQPTLASPRRAPPTPNATLAHGEEPEAEPTLVHREAERAPVEVEEEPEGTLVHGGAVLAPRPARPPGNGAEQPSDAAAPSSVFAGRFEVVAPLGEGGMGQVFRVRDRQIEGREVALKILRPRFSKSERFRELFFQEIRAAQGFVSEHVNQVRDTGRMEDGRLFLTMDLVEGESLTSVLERERSLSPRHALEVARQILLGLQSGHEKGLIHRDVKPSNVMLAQRIPKTDDNPFGVGVRLLDFGIAGLAAELEEGDLVGTPTYMSPEQVQGFRLDARSDLFGVGIVLYEMISGMRPFEGETLQQVQTAVLETDLDPSIGELERVPEAVRKILVKALQKDRDQRFQSAAEFIRAIERSKAYRVPTGVPRWAVGLLGVSVLAAGVEAVLLWQHRDRLTGMAATMASLVDDKQDAVRQAVGQAEARKDQEYGFQLGEKEGEITRLAGLVVERDGRISDLTRELTDRGDAETGFTGLTRDYEELRAQLEKAQSRNEQLASRVSELEEVQRTQERQRLPETRSAACFDELVRRIEAGAGRSALAYYEGQKEQGVFAIAHREGSDLIGHLVHLAANLEDVRADGGADARQIASAREHLRALRELETAFGLEAGPWLEVQRDGDEPPARLERLGVVVAGLAEELDAIDARLAAAREESWRAIVEGPADQDPAAAIAFARRYDQLDLSVPLARFAEHLKRSAVVDERLEVSALESSAALRAWGTWLAEEGASLDSEAADDLRLFWLALRWYAGGERTPELSRLFPVEPARTAAPHHDWRAQLALQLAFDEAGPAFPLRREQVVVLRNTWERTGDVHWFVERVEAGAEDRWEVERRIYDEEGNARGSRQTYEIVRSGAAWFSEGKRLLDLREVGEDVRVAVWDPRMADELPSKPWAHEFPFEEYREAVAAAPVPCLVFERGESEYWFSPRFGLVRELSRGAYSREQAFNSVVP